MRGCTSRNGGDKLVSSPEGAARTRWVHGRS
jgi:hypothetical protein